MLRLGSGVEAQDGLTRLEERLGPVAGCVWSAFGAGLGYGGACSRCRWVAVAEVQDASLQFLDPGQRFVCLVGGGVSGLRREVHAGLSGDDVEVVDGVSDEQGVLECA